MNIEVFYHIWGSENLDHTLLLVYEQIKTLIRSKIYEHSRIWCFVTGNYIKEISDFLSNFDFIHAILFEIEPIISYEAFTLHHMHKHATQNPTHKYLYFHTKGSSSASVDQNTSKSKVSNYNWRSVMEYVCIEEWRKRSKELRTYDTVGCRYGVGPSPHYSGNFWWATGKYLSSLPNIYEYKHPSGDRIKCEMWLCSNNPNYLNVHDELRNVAGNCNILKNIA